MSYRGLFPGADAVLEDENLLFLEQVFRRVSATNVHSEDRFARMSRSCRITNGNAAQPSTLCCTHMLAEAKTALDTNATAQGRRPHSV
eukprot:12900957-Prorocentrum_lima.AAC.1